MGRVFQIPLPFLPVISTDIEAGVFRVSEALASQLDTHTAVLSTPGANLPSLCPLNAAVACCSTRLTALGPEGGGGLLAATLTPPGQLWLQRPSHPPPPGWLLDHACAFCLSFQSSEGLQKTDLA